MKHSAMRSVLAVFVSLVFATGLFAQVEITGRIAGVVTDATKALLPGVSITVTGPTLFEPRTVVSGENGSYFVDKLPLGTYKISFALPAFRTVEQNDINVRANFTATINVTLEVGKTEETVLVTETGYEVLTLSAGSPPAPAFVTASAAATA